MGKHDPSLHFRSEVRWRLPDVTKQQLVVRWPRQPIFVNKHLSLSPPASHVATIAHISNLFLVEATRSAFQASLRPHDGGERDVGGCGWWIVEVFAQLVSNKEFGKSAA